MMDGLALSYKHTATLDKSVFHSASLGESRRAVVVSSVKLLPDELKVEVLNRCKVVKAIKQISTLDGSRIKTTFHAG